MALRGLAGDLRRRGQQARGRSFLVLLAVALVGTAVSISALQLVSRTFAGVWAVGSAYQLRASRAAGAYGPAAPSRLGLAAAAVEEPPAVWGLHMNVSDHYIWKDEDVFMGMVTDAGEYEIDTLRVRTAFKEAMDKGSAMIFDSAPLYVVKEYVKMLKTYGLRAEARKSTGAAEAGTSEEGGEKGVFRQRDWNSLPPELKDELVEKGRTGQSVASNVGTSAVRISKNTHSCLDGSKGGMRKFRAYVELAADSANKFAPEEAEMDASYRTITRSQEGYADVIMKMVPEAAEKAARQLTTAGFDVEVVVLEGETD